MKLVASAILTFRRCQSGVTSIEYALIAASVGLVLAVAIPKMVNHVQATLLPLAQGVMSEGGAFVIEEPGTARVEAAQSTSVRPENHENTPLAAAAHAVRENN